MNRLLHILRPAALIGIGLLLALASAAISGPISGSSSLASAALGGSPTPVPPAVSQVGSTDGITLVSIVIVLIVIIPIMARRKSWEN
jgi:hypothetical protein